MGQLTVDNPSCVGGHFKRTTRLHQLSGVTDGGEGIPQLVGERRQKLILATVGISQLLFERAPLCQVAHHDHPAIRQRRAVPYRYEARMDPPTWFRSRADLTFVVDGFTANSPQEISPEPLEAFPT